MRKLILALTFLLCTSCVAQEPYVVLKGERFIVELAKTREQHALGLMFRDELAEDRGMLFLFPGEARRSFWMQNTRIPLDIFYFDAERKLVSVAENVPPCRTQRCPSYPSDRPAMYVLELAGGMAARLGAQAGDELEIHID